MNLQVAKGSCAGNGTTGAERKRRLDTRGHYESGVELKFSIHDCAGGGLGFNRGFRDFIRGISSR